MPERDGARALRGLRRRWPRSRPLARDAAPDRDADDGRRERALVGRAIVFAAATHAAARDEARPPRGRGSGRRRHRRARHRRRARRGSAPRRGRAAVLVVVVPERRVGRRVEPSSAGASSLTVDAVFDVHGLFTVSPPHPRKRSGRDRIPTLSTHAAHLARFRAPGLFRPSSKVLRPRPRASGRASDGPSARGGRLTPDVDLGRRSPAASRHLRRGHPTRASCTPSTRTSTQSSCKRRVPHCAHARERAREVGGRAGGLRRLSALALLDIPSDPHGDSTACKGAARTRPSPALAASFSCDAPPLSAPRPRAFSRSPKLWHREPRQAPQQVRRRRRSTSSSSSVARTSRTCVHEPKNAGGQPANRPPPPKASAPAPAPRGEAPNLVRRAAARAAPPAAAPAAAAAHPPCAGVRTHADPPAGAKPSREPRGRGGARAVKPRAPRACAGGADGSAGEAAAAGGGSRGGSAGAATGGGAKAGCPCGDHHLSASPAAAGGSSSAGGGGGGAGPQPACRPPRL